MICGDSLLGCGMSQKASTGEDHAAIAAAGWIEQCRPDWVVLEDLSQGTRKGEASQANIAAMSDVARIARVTDRHVRRVQPHANKYVEARHLSERFPKLAPLCPPKPKLWDSEPRVMIVFEALALALIARGDPDYAL